jgi:hypothetical protein
MDMSSNGVVLGGRCKDSLCGSTDLPDPFIEYYQFSTQTFLWSKSIPTATVSSNTYKYESVQSLAFNNAGTKIVAALTEGDSNGPLVFVLMDAATGASSVKFVGSSNFLFTAYPRSLILDDSDNLFATLKKGSEYFSMVLNLGSAASKVSTWGYDVDPNIQNSKGLASISDGSTGFYSSANIINGLVFIHFSSAGAISWEIGPFGLAANSADENIRYLSLSGGYLWGCGECSDC